MTIDLSQLPEMSVGEFEQLFNLYNIDPAEAMAATIVEIGQKKFTATIFDFSFDTVPSSRTRLRCYDDQGRPHTFPQDTMLRIIFSSNSAFKVPALSAYAAQRPPLRERSICCVIL